MRHLLCLLAVSASLALTPAARADLIFEADLLAGNEVPSHATLGVGFIKVTLHSDDITLDVAETFSGLTAPAVAAHIHCCAPAGANAGVALPFPGFPSATAGTYSHTFDLSTDLSGSFVIAHGGTAQAETDFLDALKAGNTYANLHDAVFPAGEIRGQLHEISAGVPELSTWAMTIIGFGGVALQLRRRREVASPTASIRTQPSARKPPSGGLLLSARSPESVSTI